MGYGIFNFYGWSVGLHWNLMASAVWERKDHDYKNFGHNINQDGRGENTGEIKMKNMYEQCYFRSYNNKRMGPFPTLPTILLESPS